MEQGVNPAQAAAQAWADWQRLAAEAGLDWTPAPQREAELLRVWEASEYVSQNCSRYPQMLIELAGTDLHRSYGPGDLRGRLSQTLEGVADQPGLTRELRRLRRREMVRIIWRDLAGLAPLAETLEDLSELADVCVGGALGLLYTWGCEEMGTPRDEDG